MPDLKIAIIDFKLSNLYSVAHACEYVGLDATITSDPQDIKNADSLILPGVGAFADAMKNLKNLGLVDPILNHVTQKKPFMGVCLGMQLLFESSEEFGNHKGLGVFPGKVVKFPDQNPAGKNIRVPHIGWDKISIRKKSPIFKGFKDGDFMYFVHSYFVKTNSSDIIAATTDYDGVEFVSAVARDNVFAVQFHPEKSGIKGPLLYSNFARLGK